MTPHNLKGLRRALKHLQRIPVDKRTPVQKAELASIMLKIKDIEDRKKAGK